MAEAPQAQGPRVGTLLAERFRVLEVIGRGGMGIVVRAFDKVTKCEVAVKHVRPDLGADPDYADRLLREASLARDVSHHNVCRVHDVYRDGDEVLLSMEYVQGENLRRRLDRGPLLDEEALNIARQVCAGVAAAHEKGVVHRDLKPENVLIDPTGRVVVLDFGVARREGTPRDTVTGIALGTPRYMSPEQQQGKVVTPASDVYALGLLIEELFGDRRPPAWLRPVIRRATERDPNARYRDAAALGRKLARPWMRAAFLGGVALVGVAAVTALALTVSPRSLLRLLPDGPGAARDPQKTILTRQWGGAHLGTLSPDGKLLAYIEENNGVLEGLLRPLRGASHQTQRFSMAGRSITGIAFSPDSRTLVYSTGGHFTDRNSEVYTVAVDGPPESAHLVAAGTTPSWYPDGQRLIFSRYNLDTGRWHLAQVPREGGTPIAVRTEPPARQEMSPTVSPDGKLIAYVAGPSPGGLRVVPVEGGAANTLDDHPFFYERVQFTPDSRRILYGSERGDELLSIAANGREVAVTVLPGSEIPHHPSMTADGKLLLYTRAQNIYQLWLMDRDGRNGSMVRVDVTTDYLGWPLFSPDGQSIALMIGLDGKEQVILLPRAGGTGRILFPPKNGAAWPETFLDGGKSLIIGSNRAGGLEALSLVGGPPPAMNFDPADVYATVSPDGRFLATTRMEGKEGTVAGGLWVRPVSAPPGEARCWVDDAIGRPSWSLDGTRLAVATSKGLVAISRGPDQTRRIQFQDAAGAPIKPRFVRFSSNTKVLVLDSPRILEGDIETEKVQLIIQLRRINNLFGLALSPDGTQVAYVSQPTNSDLWLVESPERLILSRHAAVK